MPVRSIYSYGQVKDMAYKSIQKVAKVPMLFRQLQYQSIIIFMPSGYQINVIKEHLNNLNTKWHFIIVSDDAVFHMAKMDKNKNNGNNRD